MTWTNIKNNSKEYLDHDNYETLYSYKVPTDDIFIKSVIKNNGGIYKDTEYNNILTTAGLGTDIAFSFFFNCSSVSKVIILN